jgi:hypothetical protein
VVAATTATASIVDALDIDVDIDVVASAIVDVEIGRAHV